MKFVVTLERDESGMVVVECPAIPGCISQGRTEAEALENIREAIEGWRPARRVLADPAHAFEGPVDEDRFAVDVLSRDVAPHAAVARLVAMVS
jgi:predicted RNase H-like HicB family nuclease